MKIKDKTTWKEKEIIFITSLRKAIGQKSLTKTSQTIK